MTSITKTKPNPALQAIDTQLDALRESARLKFEKFESSILPDRLNIGVQCLKAHQIFGINLGKGGRPKKPSTVDGFSGQGFEGWLAERHPWLKKATAYRWMTAVKGLGLDENATPKEVQTALEALQNQGEVTLKSLCDAAVELIGPPPPAPPNLQQSEFDFLCAGLRDFRQEAERIVALKHQLESNPEMHKVACARAYSILYELTGTNWKPSDEPDELAFVDPDAINL